MRILIILFLCVLTRQDGLSINSTLNDTLSFLSSKSYQLVVPVSNMTTYVKVSTASSSILSSPSVSLTGTSVQTCLRQTSKTVCSVGPLKNEETYKLSVTCFLSCEYSVEIYMDPTYKITLDERIEVASKEIEQHFQFRLETTKSTEVRCLATLPDAESSQGSVSLTAKNEKNQSIQATPIWNDGQGIFLNHPGTFLIELLVSPHTKTHFQCSQINNNTRQLKLFSQLYDHVSQNQTKKYELVLSDKNYSKGEISIKFTKYVGTAKISVDSVNSSIQGQSDDSLTHFTIANPQQRYTITVQGELQATFLIETSYDEQYVVLDQDSTIIGHIDENEIDLFMYTIYTDDVSPKYFEVRIKSEDPVKYVIYRCSSLQQNGTTGCLPTSKEAINSIQPIEVATYEQPPYQYLELHIDVSLCPVRDNYHSCAIAIAVHSDTQSDYVLKFEQIGHSVDLMENIPFVDHALQNQLRYFTFSIPSTNKVEMVTFTLTMISGSCAMYDDDMRIGNTLEYGPQTNYKVTVSCTMLSTFSVLPQIYRQMGSPDPLLLQQSIIQNVYVDEEAEIMIKLDQLTNITINVDGAQAIAYEFKNDRMNKKKEMVIDKTLTFQATTNQYLVILKSEQPTTATVSYHSDSCSPAVISSIMKITANTQKCYIYKLTKLKEIQIVFVDHQLDMSSSSSQMAIRLNNDSQRQISERTTVVTTPQLIQSCTGVPCQLKITIIPKTNSTIKLVVQHTEDPILLLDGIVQYVKSNNTANFTYHVKRQQPILISVIPVDNKQYMISAGFATKQQFLQGKLPKMSFRSETDIFGSTMLLIKQVKKQHILLINVNTPNQSDFKIEVMQKMTQLTEMETKTGYVDKSQSRHYKIYTDGKKQLTVQVHPSTQYCLKMQLYDQKQGINNVSSFNNTLMISPNAKPSQCIVEISGQASCTYDISYTTSSYKIYELKRSHLFKIELYHDQIVYFIHYHNQNESFRIMAMSDFGLVNLRAAILDLPLDRLNQSKWQYSPLHPDMSLVVLKNSSIFCFKCYYVIEVSCKDPASTYIVSASTSQPIELMESVVVRETFTDQGETAKYVFMKLAMFRIKIQVTYGILNIRVSLVDETEVIKFKVQESGVFTVPYSGPKRSADKIEPNGFVIEFSCENGCSYRFQIVSDGYPTKMVEAMPIKSELLPNTNHTCFQFLSILTNKTLHFLISAENVAQVQYSFECYRRDEWKECSEDKLVQSTDVSQTGANIQLKSIDAVYLACLWSTEPVNATTMLSSNSHLRYFRENTWNLMKNQDKIEIQINNPQNFSTLIEIYECTGSVDFLATDNYTNFLDENMSFVETSRTAGHAVTKIFTSNNSNMIFARMKVEDTSSLLNFRYLYFHPDRYPYSHMKLGDSGVKYQFLQDKLLLTIETVKVNKPFSKISSQCSIFLGRQYNQVKGLSQCGISGVGGTDANSAINGKKDDLNKTAILQTIKQENQVEYLTYYVALEDLEMYLADQSFFFTSASCQLNIKDLDGASTKYRWVYDISQMTSKGPSFGISEFKSKMKFVLIWILLPLVMFSIVLFYAVRFCFYHTRRLVPTSLVEEDRIQGQKAIGSAVALPSSSMAVMPISSFGSQLRLANIN